MIHALHAARTKGGGLNPSECAVFDALAYSSGCIRLDGETGAVTLCEPGKYLFRWRAAVNAPEGAGFSLVSDRGEVLLRDRAIPNGGVYGAGELFVGRKTTLRLRYDGEQRAKFKSAPVKASMLVLRDETEAVFTLLPFEKKLLLTPEGATLPVAAKTKAQSGLAAPRALTVTQSGDYRVDAYATGIALSLARVLLELRLNGKPLPFFRQVMNCPPSKPVTFAVSGILPLSAFDRLSLAMASQTPVRFLFPTDLSILLRARRLP